MPQARHKTNQTPVKRSSLARTNQSSRKNAVEKLASMIEAHMTDLHLPETEKDARVARFSERVDRVIANRAKS